MQKYKNKILGSTAKGLKRLFIGITCLSMVMSCTLPVRAEGGATGSHAHVFKGTGYTFSALTMKYNEGTHTVAIMEECECSCGAKSSVEIRREERPHSPSFTSMGDNHPSPGEHDFRGVCECGYTTMISVYCLGGNRHVAAP